MDTIGTQDPRLGNARTPIGVTLDEGRRPLGTAGPRSMEDSANGKNTRDWIEVSGDTRKPFRDGNLGPARYVEPDTEAVEEMRPM